MSIDHHQPPHTNNSAVKEKGLLTPLSVIAMFVAFSETVLGIAVTQTSGGVQVALTCFIIILLLPVATAFFAILWYKPWHFYAPADYAGLDMPQFVDALRGVTAAITEGAKQLEAERQERMTALQEQQLRLANRNEFQRLTLEINKLVLQDPTLDRFDHAEDRKPEVIKIEALAYINMNMHELVYEYYHSATPRSEAEEIEWKTWDAMIRSAVANCSALRSIIADPESPHIYLPGYFAYVKKLLTQFESR